MPFLGYVPNPRARDAFVESGRGHFFQDVKPPSFAGKSFHMFELERKLTGKVRPPHDQQIGDCVSHGSTGALEDLQFIQIAKDPTLQFQWLSSEVMYGLARHQIGKDECGEDDGAVVAWALQAGQAYGMLPRAIYGSIDLSNYNSAIAKQFGAPGCGCPDELIPDAKSHKITNCYLVQGQNKYEQCRDALGAGGVIVTGSNTIFESTRDEQGFCKPSNTGGHCTYYRGVVDQSKRPGIVYQQSWGPTTPIEQTVTLEDGSNLTLPPGAFLIDADIFDRMHANNDSEVWVITGVDGFLTPDDQLKFHFY